MAGLSSLDGETDIAFKYDADGLRVRKEVNGEVLQYTLAGNRIVRILGQGKDVVFRYDASGRPALLQHNTVSHNGNSEFLYVYNLQGDVVALLSSSTLTPVVEYFYDAWGKPTGCTGPLANTLGKDNPFRYRGYVYDEETGLYYLRSRYYNPEWGRFVNADALITRNLFAYCGNNPVMYWDPTGMVSTNYCKGDCVTVYPFTCFCTPKSDGKVTGNTNPHVGPTPGIEFLSNEDISEDFGIGKRLVEVTDFLTNTTFPMEWSPAGDNHSDTWFAGDGIQIFQSAFNPGNTDWNNPSSWSKDARPVMITAKDKSGETRKLAYGWVPYPHQKVYANFGVGFEMCMFNGHDTQGYARGHGNDAAHNAFTGFYSIVPQRDPE